MPGMRKYGMDHDYYPWSPIVSRPPLRWPGGARLALCVIVCLEHYEWDPPASAYMPPNLPGGVGRRPFPDNHHHSRREYGNRLGVFRVMEVLDRYGIRATAAIDATVAEHYPALVEECRKRDWEFIGHGVTVNRMITSRMSQEEERRYIEVSLSAVERATGRRPVGWLGPEFGESTHTPAILAEAGVKYLCDWPNDEQPYRMSVPSGTIVSLPLMLELDDSFALWERHLSPEQWSRMLVEASRVMYRDSAHSGRLLAFTLHPWLVGQPYRIKYLDDALARLCRLRGIWKATGGEIASWYLDHS